MNQKIVSDKPAKMNELARDIHAQNLEVGWWDEFLPNQKWRRYETAMMLVVSEIAEAMEGHRKDLQDDHLPDEKMLHVEIADAAIRLLDLAGAYKIDLHHAGGGHSLEFAMARLAGKPVPAQLYLICKTAMGEDEILAIRHALADLWAFSLLHGFVMGRLIAKKRAYNDARRDHKREARAEAGGKAY